MTMEQAGGAAPQVLTEPAPRPEPPSLGVATAPA
jgi:hypothetical protein